MKNTPKSILICIFVSMLSAGCSLLDVTRTDSEEAVISEVEEITVCNPIPDKEISNVPLTPRQKSFVMGGNAFAIRLLDQISSTQEGSFIFSPISVALDFSMLAAGTTDSASEILTALGYDKSDMAEFNNYYKTLIEGLPAVDLSTKLKLSNAVIVSKAYSIKDSFRNVIQNNYYGAVESMAFDKPDRVKQIINDWVSKNTEGLIPEFLRDFSPDITACMLNAIYFKAGWLEPFNPELTKEDVFNSPEGEVKKDFMVSQQECDFLENDSFSCVSIPMGKKGKFSMTMVLPNKGEDINAVIGTIEKEGWESLSGKMRSEQVLVKIPKQDLKSEFDLIPLLKSVGINRVFQASDFSLMVEQTPAIFRVSQALQKATMTLDEGGIEAAAATFIGMEGISPQGYEQPKVKYFTADRPYLFCIQENTSGAILFVGLNNG